jgi:hypothetical protein
MRQMRTFTVGGCCVQKAMVQSVASSAMSFDLVNVTTRDKLSSLEVAIWLMTV